MKPPVYKIRLSRGAWRVFRGWKATGRAFDTQAEAQAWIDETLRELDRENWEAGE